MNGKTIIQVRDGFRFTESLSMTPQSVEGVSGMPITGREWRVRLISAGTSLNQREYPQDILHRDKDIFEGAPVFISRGWDHSWEERGVGSIEGNIKDIAAVDGGLDATLRFSDESVGVKFFDWYSEGVLANYAGLSVVTRGVWNYDESSGMDTAVELVEAESVDVVRYPAAGGGFDRATETEELSGKESDKMLTAEQVTALLEKSQESTLAAIDDKLSAQAEILRKESDMEQKEEKGLVEGTVVEAVEEPVAEDTKEESETSISKDAVAPPVMTLHPLFAQTLLDKALESTSLPEVSRTRIRNAVDLADYKPEVVDSMIQLETDHVASLIKESVENLSSQGSRIILTRDENQTRVDRIDAMFYPEGKLTKSDGTVVEGYTRWTEMYSNWYGEDPFKVNRSQVAVTMMKGLMNYDSADRQRVRALEASLVTGDLGEVMADRMHKFLLTNWKELYPQYEDWRKVARQLPGVDDYQAHRHIKYGGYANLGVVAERGTYPELVHPGDEETTITMTKRGGIAPQISREAFLNDSVGALAWIPNELIKSAKRTLYQFVFDTFVDNDTYGVDSTALFTAGHGNTTAQAANLTMGNLFVMDNKMRDQERALENAGVNDPLGEQNKMRYLFGPNELRGRARRILGPSALISSDFSADTDTNLDPNQFADSGIEWFTVDYFTSATTFYAAADPTQSPGIGVAFLQGRQEPELFVQRDETQGEMFSMDVMSIKIRHEYAKVIDDFRPFQRHTAS